MANKKEDVSFDDIIQEGRRKKAAEKLAQEIFGKKGGRASAPPGAAKSGGLGGSLASRIGVTKQRNPSVPRSTTPRLHSRGSQHNRPTRNESPRPKASRAKSGPNGSQAPPAPPREHAEIEDEDDGVELNIKGAASGPYVVVAQNFAPGTTAADIESVMLSVGGQMTGCRLVASTPTVIAEMSFVERSGAEKVIETFNGKKADGRPLYVYWRHNSGAASSRADVPERSQSARPVVESSPFVAAPPEGDVVMEVDENAESREVEDRLREERRARDERDPRDAFPTGPRGYRAEMDRYDDRRPRPSYQDGRYGFGGGGYRGGPRGRYDDRRYGGGQSWRP